MEVNINKKLIELYEIRGLPHRGWADISINAAEQHGRISIASDWGTWSYFWSHCGTPFKEFLQTVDMHYVAGKFGCGHWFDADATVRQLKVDTLESRKWTSIDKEDARALWKEIESLEHTQDRTEFFMNMSHCDKIMNRYEGTPPTYDSVHPMFRNFWRDCWPVFLEELKKEINESSNLRELVHTKA